MDTAEGTEICVNNIPVTWPLKIEAIGEANSLEKGLTLPGGFMDLMLYNRIYPTLRRKESLTLPAVKNPPLYYYLEEYIPQEAEGTAGTGAVPGSNSSRSGSGPEAYGVGETLGDEADKE